METVILTERNSPCYVREHLALLKTNSVDPNYKQNRRKDYPELFTFRYHWIEFINSQKRWFYKKQKAVFYKLGLKFKA